MVGFECSYAVPPGTAGVADLGHELLEFAIDLFFVHLQLPVFEPRIQLARDTLPVVAVHAFFRRAKAKNLANHIARPRLRLACVGSNGRCFH
jgi:hypothetical protein